MKKVLFLLSVIASITACSSSLDPEDAKAAVVQGERDRIPLVLQTLSVADVDNVTIDSLVLLVDTEPMSGMLYTTWITNKKNFFSGTTKTIETPIIVEVDSIQNDHERSGYVRWQSDWKTALVTFVAKTL